MSLVPKSAKLPREMIDAVKDLMGMGPVAHIAEVVHHGEKLTVPEGMPLDAAIDLLEQRRDYLETKMVLMETFNVFPWDGANALERVLAKRFGWAHGVPQEGFWRSNPPAVVRIACGPHEYKSVPWGDFKIPNVDGELTTGVEKKRNHIVFRLMAEIKRKDEATVQSVFDDLRRELKENSLYRGKAIKMRFLDDEGDPLAMPEPEFVDTEEIDPAQLICNPDTMASIETNLFTPITHAQDCINNGIPLKRGVLLGGTYGVGKTLAASIASRHAVDNGITYLYVPRADELAHAIEFAKQYQSPACVVFCEDIDRATAGERNVEMDDLLNIIDGIDTKSNNIIVVLTTNALETINPAMLRPGRLDAVIDFSLPTAGTVERLLRHYGGEQIAFDTELVEAAEVLAGSIPAVIAEVVKRAQLSQIKLQPKGQRVYQLSAPAILDAAKTMRAQADLLKRAAAPKEDSEEEAFGKAMRALMLKSADENQV